MFFNSHHFINSSSTSLAQINAYGYHPDSRAGRQHHWRHLLSLYALAPSRLCLHGLVCIPYCCTYYMHVSTALVVFCIINSRWNL